MKILIVKPSALGDIVLALPALSSLRASFTDAEITWFVRPEYEHLLDEVGIDAKIIFERKLLGRWWYSPVAFMELIKLIKQLRNGNFDIVFDFQGLCRTALFGWFTGSKKRFGMTTAREFAGFFYTDKVSPDSDSIHLIDYYQKIAVAAGASTRVDDYNLGVSTDDKRSIKELLARQGISGSSYAVLVHGSAKDYKCWPKEKFAALSEKLKSEFELDILIVGSNFETASAAEIVNLSNVKVFNLAGKTNIGQLKALLKGAKVVISNDTGPGHIAVGLGRAVVIIFGPTNPARIRPYKRVDSMVAFEPENRGTDIESSDPRYAIGNVTVEEVFEMVRKQLFLSQRG